MCMAFINHVYEYLYIYTDICVGVGVDSQLAIPKAPPLCPGVCLICKLGIESRYCVQRD